MNDDSTMNDDDIFRQTLLQATHRLEQARCKEAELEAWTVYASTLLKVPPGGAPPDNLAGGLQDAWNAAADVTALGVAGTNVPDNHSAGQWAATVQRQQQAASIQAVAQQAQAILSDRLLEGGPALQQASQTLAKYPDPNLWLRMLDERLQSLRAYHARHAAAPVNKRPRLGNPAADGYDLAAAVTQQLVPLQQNEVFSTAEVMGKYLDLYAFYERTLHTDDWFRPTNDNKSQQTSWIYVDFLQVLSRQGLQEAWPESTKLHVRKKYLRFLTDLQTYLRSFLNRTVPLLNVADLEQQAQQALDEEWSRTGGSQPAWQAIPAQAIWAQTASPDDNNEAPAKPTMDLSVYKTASDLETALDGERLKSELARLGLKCGGTVADRAKRLFLLKDTPLSDLAPKHFAKKSTHSTTASAADKMEYGSRRIDLARLEAVVTALLDQVRPTLEATVRRAERQMGQTLAEREREYQEELYGSQVVPIKKKTETDSDEDDDDAPIYNPKNVPLDWDGKPIPYWLFKLHGLNHYYPCEICGGETYRGRRNFELHFAEQKHSAGMKSLGIPNTKHFHGVTKIDDARQLWETLGAKLNQEQFDGTHQEEYEDSHGNVLSRTTYEDLARQGLL